MMTNERAASQAEALKEILRVTAKEWELNDEHN